MDMKFPFRVGHGYDVHRLCENRRLILGGVEIPHAFGLLGHSDADVLLHAIMDAVLGALALGDIGKYFPDNDAKWKDADSKELAAKTAQMMARQGWRIGNIDATILAQKPKLAPYIPAMQKCIAEIYGITPDNVNIKATTEEALGFTGREEGIAAHAILLIYRIE